MVFSSPAGLRYLLRLHSIDNFQSIIDYSHMHNSEIQASAAELLTDLKLG